MPDGTSAQQAHGVPNQLPGLSRLQHTQLFPEKTTHLFSRGEKSNGLKQYRAGMKNGLHVGARKGKAGMEVTVKQRASV